MGRWLGVSFLALLLVALPSLAAGATLRPFGGPVLAAEAALGQDATLEFRYAFYLVQGAEAYVVNTPSPFNAAFREGWSTRLDLVDADGVRSLGSLEGDRPLELGALQSNRTYGLSLWVAVPALDLDAARQLNLTYALALHTPRCAGCAGSGAAQDESMSIRLTVHAVQDAARQDLGPWQLPAVPFTATAAPPAAFPAWIAWAAGLAGVAVIAAAALGLVARQRRV